MSVLVGLNGYGRIGRIFHRIVLAPGPGAGIAVGAINDPAADASTLAFLLEHDSVYGGLGTPVEGSDGALDLALHQLIGNASCTTNCLAPMAQVLDERFGIDHGYMTTVHAFTTDQNLLDLPRTSRSGKADLRRMRAASLSIVPTSTGATQAVGTVLPRLDGRLDGLALRVPVPDGSVVDLVATLHKEVDRDEVNGAFAEAGADPSYRRVIEHTEQPLVSADIVGNAAFCVFSAADTMAGEKMGLPARMWVIAPV